jgi:hypothetical protein
MSTDRPACRMQVADGDVLIAEVVGEFDAFGPFGGYWQRFAAAKHRAGKSCGGAVTKRADLPRTWDVPVGSRIP